MRNMWPSYKGGAVSRAGTAFVGRSKQNAATQSAPHLINFQFSISQGYCLEFGDNYMRVISDGAFVLESAKTITGATQANPCVITSATHGFSNGDWVFITGVNGMTQLNGNTYIVAGAATNSFALTDLDGNNINSTGYGAYTSGGTAARIFTLTTPYAAVDLPYLKYAQSADVMFLCCVNPATGTSYPPQQLKRFAANNWTISALTFAALIAAPNGVVVTPTVPPNPSTTPKILPCSYGYVITAVDTNTGQESIGSVLTSTTVGVDMSVTAGSNIVTWNAVAGAAYYNVYRTLANYNTQPSSPAAALPPAFGSPTGFVGQTAAPEFVDSNITPDFSQVPPQHRNPFAPGEVLYLTVTAAGTGYSYNDTVTITSGTGSGFLGFLVVNSAGNVATIGVLDPGQNYRNTDTVAITTAGGTGATATITVGPLTGTYPGVCAFFQERLTFAQTANQPDTLWFSHPGDYLNFDIRIPTQADDSIEVTPFGQQVNGVEFLVPMPGGLVVLTGLQAWQILGPGSFGATSVQAITPSSISAVPQAYNGINATVPPQIINYDILYVQSRGSVVRDLSYNFFANIYTGTDLTVLSSHLFQNFSIVDAAWCEEPNKLYWFVRDDGSLLSLTFLKEQEISAWARHDTQGQVRSVCSVEEPPVNALYLAVQRSYNPTSGTIYMIERMDNRLWSGVEDSWCVDAGVATQLGTPQTQLFANTASGTVTFKAQGGSPFILGHVGQVIRMGGGIATITAFVSGTQVTATWNFPCQNTVPGFPNQPFGVAPGGWTLAPNITTVSGLQHLVGQSVVGIADGVPIGPLTVSATGTVTLPFPASNVKIGLAFTVQLQSIYLDDGQPTIQGRRKAIYDVTVRVAQAGSGFQMGTNQVDGSTQNPPIIAPVWSAGMSTVASSGSTYTSPGGQTVTNLFDGDVYKNVQAAWRKPGQVAMQQSSPLPFSALDIVPEYLPGDIPEAFVSTNKDKQQQARP